MGALSDVFRKRLGEGYFRLDLPQEVKRAEVEKALTQFRELRARISETPADNVRTVVLKHSFNK
jgi:hypothetical protein